MKGQDRKPETGDAQWHKRVYEEMMATIARTRVAYAALPELTPQSEEDFLGRWKRVNQNVRPRADPVAELRANIRDRQAEQGYRMQGLKSCQQKLAQVDAEIALLTKSLNGGASEGYNPEHAAQVIQELLTLLTLPGVVGFEYGQDEEFHLFYNPRVEYQGKVYDFGDWELIFGAPLRRQPNMVCLRTGALPEFAQAQHENLGGGFYTNPSPYYYPNRPSWKYEENKFCLNFRKTTVQKFMQRGDWLSAMLTACEALRSIGGYEESLNRKTIPQLFQEVRPANPSDQSRKETHERQVSPALHAG